MLLKPSVDYHDDAEKERKRGNGTIAGVDLHDVEQRGGKAMTLHYPDTALAVAA